MIAENAVGLPWLSPVEAALERHGGTGAYLVLFETYRPDLVRAMAHAMSMRFIDFREQHMLPLGRDAARMPLARIGEAVVACDADGAAPDCRQTERQSGIVLHNVEALLASRDSSARANWMAGFIALPTRVPVIVPLAVFTNEAPEASTRVARIEASCVPQEKLLLRLAGQ